MMGLDGTGRPGGEGAAGGVDCTHGTVQPIPVCAHGVEFSYGHVGVLTGADLDVRPGGLAVLTGGNGAGKSTLLKLILGEERPSAGSIRLFGEDPASFRDWARVGYVPQRVASTYDRFPATVTEVVRANRYARTGFLHRSPKADLEACARALRRVDLEGLGDRLVGELSGGQLQRVLLARALVNDPLLLVLEEPTSGLDEESAREFIALMGGRRRDVGAAVLLVTHDLERLEGLGGTVYRLSAGAIEEVA